MGRILTYKAYIDNIKTQTGKGPEQYRAMAKRNDPELGGLSSKPAAQTVTERSPRPCPAVSSQCRRGVRR